MEVTIDRALTAFHNLPRDLQYPSFNPHYVAIDACRTDADPVFFHYQEAGWVFYHAFLCTPIVGSNFFDIESPYGYGGPLATTNDSGFLERAWSSYNEWCKSRGVLAEFIRFHPLAKNWISYPGKVWLNRETVWIDLCSPSGIGYEQRVRTAVKKAAQKVNIEIGETQIELSSFRRLYDSLMREIGASSFYLFPESYFESFKMWQDTFLAVARSNNEIVAASLFMTGGSNIEYHLSAANTQGKRLSASNLLLHEVSEFARSRGLKKFHLGGGTDQSPDNRLLFFKAGFSPLRGQFHVGGRVINQPGYDALKKLWIEKHGTAADRILFYR